MNSKLKKISVMLLMGAMSLCAVAAPVKSSTDSAKSIKILCYGNSFTLDAMSYVPFILKNVDPSLEVTIGIGFIGGGRLAQQLASITGITCYLDGNSFHPQNYTYFKFTPSDTAWQRTANVESSTMLADEDWDVITFQQNGLAAWDSWDTYYAPFITKIKINIKAKTASHPVKLGWLLTQGAYPDSTKVHADQLAHWKGTATNSKRVMDEIGFDVLFPYGTALQTLRTTPLDSLGDGTGMTVDRSHLQEGIGCLVSAYTNASTILQLANSEATVVGDTLRPDSAWITKVAIPDSDIGTGVIGIDERNCEMAQKAAIAAEHFPYELAKVSTDEKGTTIISINGDVNGDYKVNTTDLTQQTSYILNEGSFNSLYDINADGAIDTSDIGPLMRLILQ